MNDRDKLLGYPCNPLRLRSRCTEDCLAGNTPCERRDVYRAHIKLRDAVLGEMTPAVAREIYSAIAGLCEGMALYNAAGRLHALADVVAKL